MDAKFEAILTSLPSKEPRSHLEHSDYYAEGERVVGQWQGRGAELLGLSGDVESQQFEALRQSLHPETGEFLRQRHSTDRIAVDGTTQSRGRNLYDFTISAPKSVSVMAVLGGDERLVEAHKKAVQEALTELEAHAGSRVRQNGANEDRTTGNLVLAVYHHDTSRELDPQLHTHAVAANLTYDGAEGRWKALQASDIYEARAYLTEVYRNALAREVRSLGYEIQDRRDNRGRDLGFDIKGVSGELLEKYSQRSQQRDQAIGVFVKENGRQPTDNEVAVLVQETRADKLTEISSEEVHARQRERLSPEETLSLSQVSEDALKMSRTQELDSAAASLDYAKKHVFERVSVAHDHELLTEALRHGRGRVDLAELKGTLAIQESAGEILRFGKEVTTSESLDRERDMIAQINRGIGQFERLGGQHEFTVSARLRPEQKSVVEFVLDSRDRAVNIHGAAGTGKTATLQEVHRGLEESGSRVLAVAPTMNAVEELRKVGFSDAVTVERLLQDQSAQAELRGRVLVVDEAGMISGRQMSELLNLAEHQSARIVFSGDTRQIQSVEASDALRVLEKESQLNSISLSEVQRQKVHSYREAVEELRRDPERGFNKLEKMGAIREVSWQDRAQAVQQAYSEAQAQPNSKGGERNVLVVAATHEEIGQITEAIRGERLRVGTLGESVRCERHVSLNWTTAQKSEARNYREGQVLGFHRAVKSVEKNETLDVIRVKGKHVIARNMNGEERQFTAKQVKAFDVYERRSIDVAPNDRLLLTANRREPGFRANNGELVAVSRIDGQGRIHLQDGRSLPENYKQFTHGYAVTAHRSQGQSVDAVVISADRMRKELFYVAASRGRESITIVTSDKEFLRESVGRSSARQSASELVRKAQSPSLEESTLRQQLRERPVPREQVRDTALEEVGPSKKVPEPDTVQPIDMGRAISEKMQDDIHEPSQFHGISR